jgi:hypothetical protein
MSWMSAKPLALLLGLLAVPGGEKFADGVRHFREGRFEKSYALLRDVEKAHGDKELPAALLVDLALAASKTGRFDEAEGYAERVAARDARLGYLRDQVVGAARYFAARKAAQVAEAPGAQSPDIKKLDEALTLVRRAVEAFGSAIMARPDALEARRNLERALELEKELEKKKKEADEKKKDDEKKDDEKKKDDKKKDDKDKKDKDDKGKKDENKDEKKQDKKDDNKDDKKGEDEQKQPEKADPKGKQEEQPLKQLSPEEKKRLEQVLEDYQKALVELKKSRAPKHQPGKKDW